jgi:hypothetical protein
LPAAVSACLLVLTIRRVIDTALREVDKDRRLRVLRVAMGLEKASTTTSSSNKAVQGTAQPPSQDPGNTGAEAAQQVETQEPNTGPSDSTGSTGAADTPGTSSQQQENQQEAETPQQSWLQQDGPRGGEEDEGPDVSTLPAGVEADALLASVTQLIADMEDQQVVADR